MINPVHSALKKKHSPVEEIDMQMVGSILCGEKNKDAGMKLQRY